MKKIIIILMLSLILILVGILYGDNERLVQEEIMKLEEIYTTHSSETKPNLTLRQKEKKLFEILHP